MAAKDATAKDDQNDDAKDIKNKAKKARPSSRITHVTCIASVYIHDPEAVEKATEKINIDAKLQKDETPEKHPDVQYPQQSVHVHVNDICVSHSCQGVNIF